MAVKTLIKFGTLFQEVPGDISTEAAKAALEENFPDIKKAVAETYSKDGNKVIEFKIKAGDLG